MLLTAPKDTSKTLRVKQQKHCDYNNQDEENSLNCVNSNNSSSEKFRCH